MNRFLCAVALLAVSCSSDFVPPPHVDACKTLRQEQKVFHADQAFTPEERDSLALAANDWYAFSDGQVDYRVMFDLDTLRTLEPMILRAESWMDEVRAYESLLKNEDYEPYHVAGYKQSNPLRITLVMDRVGGVPSDLRYLAAHEMGHVAGLKWPDCYDTSLVCKHSPDPSALMAPVFSAAPFNDADKALCRASCLCR